MDKSKWEKFFKDNGYEVWNIGTNVSTYIDNTVIEWIKFIDKNNSKINEYKNDSNEIINYYFSEASAIAFYCNYKEKNSNSTNKQLMNVLSSVNIIENKNNFKQVNPELIDFYQKQVNQIQKLSNKEIIYSFIRSELANLLKEYIINPLKNNESYNFDEFGCVNKNSQKTKFWFNVLLTMDSNYFESSFAKNWDIEFDNTYYKEFVSNLLGSHLVSENSSYDHVMGIFSDIISKIDNITNIKNVSWEFIDIKNSLTNDISNMNDKDETKEKNPLLDKLNNLTTNMDIISEVVSFKEFVECWDHLKYKIPIFQRIYSWDEQMIKGLFNNIFEGSKNNKNSFSFLNSIILMNVNNRYNIVDGQQRIISLLIIYLAIFRKAKYLGDEKTLNILKSLGSFGADKRNILYNLSDKFDENYDYYDQLRELYYLDDETKIDKKIRIYRNYNEIVREVEEKISYENIEDFTKYFINNVKFNINLIKDDSENALNKIFQNMNQYSKRLGALDLLRNLVFEKTNGNNNFIKLFNNSINIFFRKNHKLDADENIKEILVFLDSWLAKSNKINKIDDINDCFYDNTTRAFEKFKILIDEFKTSNNLILDIWKEIIIYEYAKTGSLIVINKLISNNATFFKNDAVLLKESVNEFSRKLEYIKFINFQIHHLTTGNSKSIYTPLIWTLIQKMQIFDNITNNKEKLLIFSKILHKIEKFGALWEISFEGQSFSKQILSITRDTLYKNDNIDETIANVIYNKLYEILPVSFRKLDKNTKINKYLEELKNLYDYEITDSDDKFKSPHNRIYKIIIGRVFNGFNNKKQPFWYEEYSSNEEREKSIDFINYSYEHFLPQRPNDDIKKCLNENDIDISTKYASLVFKIGNGVLLDKEDNAKMSNKSKKNYVLYGIRNITTQKAQIPGLKSLDSENDIFISPLPFASDEEKFNFTLDKFLKIQDTINKRSKEIINAYLYILFGDEIDNKEN
ncbi:DUF262 domain-containing protein [Mycoplasmopsis cynos]|uniref:DUF262 domain-containing protein n=1 Tax=Mycoplasmopsis cynos TaxID=171284 RepID=UPI002AFF6412|nr:DUF262 domain-containing protein [Mycoplasmopsis cynos]WQQ18121.1 DUF262 domain-containing protein [Mycoplasmopsis cynos]